jgi:trans-aconitate methyltransferase
VRDELARWRTAHPELASRLDEEALAYGDYHAPRYARLLQEVSAHLGGRRAPAILDVGPNLQTVLLRLRHPQATIDTLGFRHPAVPPREHEQHIEFDLNQALLRERRPAWPRSYDLVVVAEVVEHLHVPVHAVLGCLRASLVPGGVVILQTPNGAALHKRLRLLAGRSPVEPPRASSANPGHLHEYTLAELRDQVAMAGLQLEHLETANYFKATGFSPRLYRAGGRLMPTAWRHGITLCAR